MPNLTGFQSSGLLKKGQNEIATTPVWFGGMKLKTKGAVSVTVEAYNVAASASEADANLVGFCITQAVLGDKDSCFPAEPVACHSGLFANISDSDDAEAVVYFKPIR